MPTPADPDRSAAATPTPLTAAGAPASPVQPAAASYVARMRRYILAACGPVAVAGANFLLSFSMLQLESPAAFGTFSFLFAAALFTVALSSALFGAPMQALHGIGGQRVVTAVAAVAVLAALAAAPIFALLGAVLGLGPGGAACYGVFSMLTILRSVGRAWSYSVERPWAVMLSDSSYALVTLGTFAAAAGFADAAAAEAVFPSLALGTIASVASMGSGFARLLWRSPWSGLRAYREIWHGQSRWSLLGVTSNEAVANAHIYLLTVFAGTAAVAPVAASALLVRPINVIQNALIEYERPQMARFLSIGAAQDVDRSIWLFRLVLLIVWGGTVGVGAMILILRPSLIFPASYDLATISLAAIFWATLSLVIALQVPLNVLLQARGDFRTLAWASVCASAVSVTGVLLAIAIGASAWTIAALVPGWLLSTMIVARAARRLRGSLIRTSDGFPDDLFPRQKRR